MEHCQVKCDNLSAPQSSAVEQMLAETATARSHLFGLLLRLALHCSWLRIATCRRLRSSRWQAAARHSTHVHTCGHAAYILRLDWRFAARRPLGGAAHRRRRGGNWLGCRFCRHCRKLKSAARQAWGAQQSLSTSHWGLAGWRLGRETHWATSRQQAKLQHSMSGCKAPMHAEVCAPLRPPPSCAAWGGRRAWPLPYCKLAL